jgi:hypothetical protein
MTTEDFFDLIEPHAEAADGELVLVSRTGSRAYGTDNPDSDHDFRGVYVAGLRRVLSLGGAKDALELNSIAEDADVVVYELAHFARLAAKANPTALEMLWSDDQMIDAYSAGGQLINSRGLFLSKRIVHTYGGYAVSQLRKAREGTGGSRGASHHKRTKFKLHTLRLLMAGVHALKHGEVLVRLQPLQVEWLKGVAEKDLDKVESIAEAMLITLDNAAAYSKLPDEPDMGKINHLVYRIRMGF